MDERLLPVARDEVDAARAAFTASLAPFVAVVDAEKNLRGVELDRQTALADCDRRRAELDRALGRIPGISAEGGRP
jgi:outer membrane protein TolC